MKPRLAVPAVGAAVLLASAGCVRRTITITSEPLGALVWLNDREIGRTPVSTDFDYYGTYDVRLRLAGYEPMTTSGQADAPWWETVGIDLCAELVPGTLHSRVYWHYVLQPLDDDPEAILRRAGDLRARVPTDGTPGEEPPSSGPSP